MCQAETYNRGRQETKIKIGDQVRLSIGEKPRGVPGKFVRPFRVPLYTVVERRGELLAKLADADGKPAKLQNGHDLGWVNVQRLKVVHEIC